MASVSIEATEELLECLKVEKLESKDFEHIKEIIDSEEIEGRIIEYSVISEHLKELDSEVLDVLKANTKILKRQKNLKLTENCLKILENILLEIPKAIEFNNIRSLADRNEKAMREFRTETRMNKRAMEMNKRTMDKQEAKMDKMQGEFISILSIFAAVIIAFFGGINLLGSTLTNINNSSKYRLIFVVIIIGLVMFNIIYMLLYSISRLTHKSIGVQRSSKQCAECEKNINMVCVSKKYPVVFFYNSISLILLLITSVLYYIDMYNLITYIIYKIDFIPDRLDMVGFVGIGLCIINIVISKYIIIPYAKKKDFWGMFPKNYCGNIKEESTEISNEIVSTINFENIFNNLNESAVDEL